MQDPLREPAGGASRGGLDRRLAPERAAPKRKEVFSGRASRVCLRYPGRSLLELFERAPYGARSRVVPR